MDRNKIAEKLIELRGGRTQEEVAEAVGVTPAAISQYESGSRVPIDEVKVKIAEFYGVTVQSIFFEK